MNRSLKMSQRQLRVLRNSLLASLTLLFIPSGFAQDASGGVAAGTSTSVSSEEVVRTKSDKKVEKVKVGTIANSGTSVASGAVDVQTSGASPGDTPSPITGSISVQDRRRCLASVQNNSKENTYSVRFKVQGSNERGTRTVNKSFTARLAPGASTSRTFTCNADDQMSVVLSSATKVGN